jgi:endoglucanase
MRTALTWALAGLLGLSVRQFASAAGSVREPITPDRLPVSASTTLGASNRFGIKVTGNTFTDLSGNVLQLQGEAVSGLGISYAPSMWDGYNNTSVSTWVSIRNAWQMNIIRLDMNEYNWRVNAKSSGRTPYQTIVINTVNNITLAGMYVIIDLHWAAPNAYNGSLSGHNAAGYADGQPGYLDADNAIGFWSSIATTFKTNPAVLFELFNEPFADSTGSAWDSTRLGLLLNGGSYTFHDQAMGQGSPVNTDITFTVAGHQQLVDAIRNAGATNVILYSCPNWDNNPSQSLSVKPNDSLNQLGATVHYAGGSNADYNNILNAGIPIVLTEYYTLADRGGYSWAQANHIGYVMWGPNNWSSAANLGFLITQSPWSFNSNGQGSNTAQAWPL